MLHSQTFLDIAYVSILKNSSLGDVLLWSGTLDEKYNVKSTYNLSFGSNANEVQKVWKLLWRVKVPKRI